MAEETQLRVSCMCGAARHSFTAPNSKLPMPMHPCSCNISRRISGSLFTSYLDISFADNKPDLTALTGYKSSDILTRHFCSICGTHMYLEYHDDGHFEVSTGSLDIEDGDGILDVRSLMWIEDTKDGGASEFVREVGGKTLKRWLRERDQSEEVPLWYRSSTSDTQEQQTDDKLYAHCHCGGVEFWVSKPSAQSKNAKSPYPDLMIPYHSGSSANPSNQPWWLPDPDRFLAGTCACTSCRKASGFDITFWSFIPTIDITPDKEGTESFHRDPYWGTMKSYRSSHNVTRTFCGVCGANVFWDGDERPSLVDVAVGLLDADSGARADEWLAWWTERVSFAELAANMAFVGGLEQGLKEWAKHNKWSKSVAQRKLPPVA